MITDFLNFCLQMVVSSVSISWLFAPVLVMALFCIVIRISKRRFE